VGRMRSTPLNPPPSHPLAARARPPPQVIGAACAVASSLVMGKEGPMLHVGSAVAVLLGSSRWFKMQMDKAMHWGAGGAGVWRVQEG